MSQSRDSLSLDGTPTVVHIANWLRPGGAERMLLRLLARLNRRFFNPVVVTLTEGGGPIYGEIRSLNIPLYCASIPRGLPTPASTIRLVNMVRGFRPALIQGWLYHGSLASLFAAQFLTHRPPVLWNIRHSLHDLSRDKATTRFVIRSCAYTSRFADTIIYNSRRSAEQHEEYGFFDGNRRVISNGFDLSVFRPSLRAAAEVRAELGLSADDALIVHVARFHPTKGHHILLRALASLPGKNYLIMVGHGVDSNNYELLSLMRELGLSDRTFLLGERHDIPRLLAGADVAVSPSFGEAFPNVVGEAMACGIPCVVTDVGESAEIVGRTGRVVPPGSPTLIAAAIQELLELSPKERECLGLRARERIRERYSIATVVQAYDELYRSALDQSKKS